MEGGGVLLRDCGLCPLAAPAQAPQPQAEAMVLGAREIAMRTVYFGILDFLAKQSSPAPRRSIEAAVQRTKKEIQWPLTRIVGALGWASRTMTTETIVDPRVGGQYTHEGKLAVYSITDRGRAALEGLRQQIEGTGPA